nr:MAG TPA: hypothetical protein [Caudoviricetes sp.]
MLYLIVYFFDIYGDILFLTKSLGVFFALLAIIAYVSFCVVDADMVYLSDEDKRKALDGNKRMGKKSLKYTLVAVLLATFLPSKQGLAMLGGVYVGQQVYEGISQSELVGKAVKVLNIELDGYLDKYLKEKETQSPK